MAIYYLCNGTQVGRYMSRMGESYMASVMYDLSVGLSNFQFYAHMLFGTD